MTIDIYANLPDRVQILETNFNKILDLVLELVASNDGTRGDTEALKKHVKRETAKMIIDIKASEDDYVKALDSLDITGNILLSMSNPAYKKSLSLERSIKVLSGVAPKVLKREIAGIISPKVTNLVVRTRAANRNELLNYEEKEKELSLLITDVIYVTEYFISKCLIRELPKTKLVNKILSIAFDVEKVLRNWRDFFVRNRDKVVTDASVLNN